MTGTVTPRGVQAGASGCQATRANGQPCRATPVNGESFCCFHHPGFAERRRTALAAGAVKANRLRALRGKRPRIEQPAAMARFTAGLVLDCVDGLIDPGVARTALYGVSVLRQVVEASDLEQRLAALEQAAPQPGGRQWRT